MAITASSGTWGRSRAARDWKHHEVVVDFTWSPLTKFLSFGRCRKLSAKADRVNEQQRRESRAADIGKRPKNKQSSRKSGPSAGGEAPRPSKFELPCAGGGPTRLTKPPKLHSFRLRGSQIREVPHFRAVGSGATMRVRCTLITASSPCEGPLGDPHRAGFRWQRFRAAKCSA
jgi:hypothetical protein